jgi:hypothetical protein
VFLEGVGGELEGGQDVGSLQVRVAGQDLFGRLPCGQLAQDRAVSAVAVRTRQPRPELSSARRRPRARSRPGGKIGGRWPLAGTRAHDRLDLDLDFRQLDEIERTRNGGPLQFTITLGGVAYHDGKVGTPYPANHTLIYTVGASDWQQVLSQFSYGTFVNVEIPVTSSNGVTGEVREATEALQQALQAFRRGEYEEAASDCRPALEDLIAPGKGKFSLKPGDQNATKDERFYWLQRSLLSVVHLAHHPNDPAANSDRARWLRSDAEAVISVLASLIRHKTA